MNFINRHLETIILIGCFAGAGYLLLGDYGLLAGLLRYIFPSAKKSKEKAKASITEADVYKKHAELQKNKAKESQEEANQTHDESVNIANDITVPQEPVKDGYTRKRFSAS